MTYDQTRDLLDIYLVRLIEYQPVALPDLNSSFRHVEAMSHLHWMVRKCFAIVYDAECLERNGALRELVQDQKEKIHRWIGFIQGMLCALGVFTIDELRGHVTRVKNETPV